MSTTLTPSQRATNFETMRHIERVRNLLNVVILELLRRGELHDQSKLASPEVELFDELTPKLSDPKTVYGSEEYKRCLEALGPALRHHYAHNSHHPEHFQRGVDDMNLIDLMEMLVDWKAAGERHADGGNLRRSIKINTPRFGLSDQLVRIFENTVPLLEGR